MSYDDEIQRLTEIERITDDKSSYFDMDEAGVSLHGSNPATHVRFGSKADINRTIANAAFPRKQTSVSTIVISALPKADISRLGRCWPPLEREFSLVRS
jgi:hypothetical protein